MTGATEKVYLRDVNYKHAQLLKVDPSQRKQTFATAWVYASYLLDFRVNVGLPVICNVYIKIDSKTYETYNALHENIFAPSFSHIH